MGESKIALELKNLGKVFKDGESRVTALEDINLEINAGEIFGIVGMSGAGKSTLVRMMNFLEQPTEGTVWVGGENLAELSPERLRKKRRSIGMVFQQYALLMQYTVLENVLLPLKIAGADKISARKKALELLELVGISDKAGAYPSKLSGGQKQRVGIARALATDPEILLCDEATSALDPSTTAGVLELLAEINREKGITVVIITHEMDVVEKICHRVAIMDSARIAEIGRVEKVFSAPESEAAKKLFFKENRYYLPDSPGPGKLRVVFTESEYARPIIADMILELGIPVSILYADIRNIDAENYGQTILQVPEGEGNVPKVIEYLRAKNLTVAEVSGRADD